MNSRPSMFDGKSLLNEALSPTAKEFLADFLEPGTVTAPASATSTAASSFRAPPRSRTSSSGSGHAATKSSSFSLASAPSFAARPRHPSSSSSAMGSPSAVTSSSPVSSMPPRAGSSIAPAPAAPVSRFFMTGGNFYVVECHHRPFGLRLSCVNGEILVDGFAPDPVTKRKGAVEASAKVFVGDVLMAINDNMDALVSVERTLDALERAPLPTTLMFRRKRIEKRTLGEYTKDDIIHELQVTDNSLAKLHGVDDAAALVKACIQVLDDDKTELPLMSYVRRVEQMVCPTVGVDNTAQRLEEITLLMDQVHTYVENDTKATLRKWNAVKASTVKRIDVLVQQRSAIDKKLDKMRAQPALLHPENHGIWGEYIELRHLSTQLKDTIEETKRAHFLPAWENYSLRFGSDGVYVGVGDVWISSFHAKFTIETRSQAPHVFFHLSTPSSSGLKLRATNFKLATEGRLPSFQCDELNLEAQLVAEIPFVFDPIAGWSVPDEDLDVKLQSLNYYERQAHSTKKGKDHDTMMKMFINRLLPTVVRYAAQQLFCVELGPLLVSRNAQMMLSGEIRIHGRPLGLYDAPLNTPRPGHSDDPLAEEARDLVALSEDEADVLLQVLHSVEALRHKKRLLPGGDDARHLSIRRLTAYFDQFKNMPNVRRLMAELWQQQLQLLTGATNGAEGSSVSASGASFAATPFSTILQNMEHINQYPVDVSVSILDMTCRLDLCEAAATYYTCLQRIIRQKMDSANVSVRLTNLDSLKDGTAYLENQLAQLDEYYDHVSRMLAYLTSNVDEFGVILRGGIPSGFMSNLFLEAHDLICKGPCTGSVEIPLTDLTKLPTRADLMNAADTTPSFTTMTHEKGAFVLSKFLYAASRDTDDEDALATHSNNGNDHDVATQGDDENTLHRRLRVSVKNTSVRVVFEVPATATPLTVGQSFVPFSFSLATSEHEPPMIRLETGPYSKCQYKAEKVSVSGGVWQFLKKTKEATDEAVGKDGANTNAGVADATNAQDSGGVWEDYMDSPFFCIKFHFFTSCQVTREHIYWSIKSASLSEPKVAQLKHRVCLTQLLQDIGMLSVVQDVESTKRREEQRFRRALRFKTQGGHAPGGGVSFSTMSGRDTLFSQTESADDFDDMFGDNTSVLETSYVEDTSDVSPPAVSASNAPARVLSPVVSPTNSESVFF
ncbi:TPA: hypothetical protein N0F65_001102 [Lagenidium giganteum]|uniref:PDZ domain-containing protein n=1 Tax=Lagenidium giganteum TaxID=4803 RepID=A0AAV2YKM2_9STRA|nr:TPA: hypothetical protein N0F65_001102 [Lagenidium giganteum]